MDFFERFKRKMELTGGTLRNEKIFNSRKLLDEVFADDASHALGIYFWELGKQSYNEDDNLGIRFYNRASSAANGVTAEFQTLYNKPVIVGDILFDSINNEYWLCEASFIIDDIHYQGKLKLCNWFLKWQNEQGKILEYPCYNANTTQYNTGETPNRQFTVGSSQHSVWLPCDSNTVILDTPKRFFLDKNYQHPTTYIITQNDTTSLNFGTKGLIRLTLAEYEFNSAKDRIDLGVCDYFDNDNIQSDVLDNSTENVIIYDTKIIKSGGSPKIYIGKLYDNNGNEIDSNLIQWDIVCSFKNEFKRSVNGNTLTLSIDNDDYIDESFKIICSDVTGTYSAELIITVESLL